jgi:hypothetical protein
VVNPFDGILFNKKKEQNTDACNIDESLMYLEKEAHPKWLHTAQFHVGVLLIMARLLTENEAAVARPRINYKRKQNFGVIGMP